MRHVGQGQGQLASLVVVGARLGAIASADERNAQTSLDKPAGEPGNEGGFARSAESQIADADDGRRNALPMAGLS